MLHKLHKKPCVAHAGRQWCVGNKQQLESAADFNRIVTKFGFMANFLLLQKIHLKD